MERGAVNNNLAQPSEYEQVSTVTISLPTGQQETIDRAAERVATWPEWKRNAVRYRDDSDQQAATEIPPAVTEADIRAIQAIREAWNRVTDAELLEIKGYLGEGVSAYQFWLELHYVRATADIARIKERYATQEP